ncbi:MAG: cysteine desulfurase [Fimbriimonadales bacterium]|nr:cysteine desulfurase [Fimbriimonadales bacterium]
MTSVRDAVSFDVERIRRDFPILGKGIAYLDNAATTQKPQRVIDRITRFYREQNGNVHRGVHDLSVMATREYEGARQRIAKDINAKSEREIVFVRGTTEAINLVAQSFVRPKLKQGSRVLITAMEHHSNIVPWQAICGETGAKLDVAPIDDNGDVVLEAFDRLVRKGPVIASFASVSNALGTVNPIKEMIEMCKSNGVPTLIDGAQSVPHTRVDVRDIDCDFFAFSSHKAFGPTGIGALYGREELLNAMQPYQYGGDMILYVSFEHTEYAPSPARFEAGTPHIAGAIGMAEAIDYVREIGDFRLHENRLIDSAVQRLHEIDGVRLVGMPKRRMGVVSFLLDGVHPHDVGTILNESGVAIRAGHHCAQPLMHRFDIPGTCRASFAFYNNEAEVDALIAGVRKAKEVFSQ